MNYLQWLSEETPTHWWHDSGDPQELCQAKAWGARGVTTNPLLTYQTLRGNRTHWAEAFAGLRQGMGVHEKAEHLMGVVVREAAKLFQEVHEQTRGRLGYVCAQIDPSLASDREAMMTMARRFGAWARNVSVKLPATAAGLDILEECAAEGICATSTVSFTVSQVVAAAERYRRGRLRAERAGLHPSPCFAVIMIGRIDDYLWDVVQDRKAHVSKEDIKQAGLAIVKRAYHIFTDNNYEAQLLVAALRGTHHMLGLCGAGLVMSIHPKIQKQLLTTDLAREAGIDKPVEKDIIRRLQSIPEFIKAYEAGGLHEQDFITFGLTQRTLSQFSTAGWSLIEELNK